MCWFTLSPAKSKKPRAPRSSDSSCVEQLVRVHSNPARPRFTQVKVKVPSSVSMDMSEQHHHPHHLLNHHHRHPHLHVDLDLDHHHRHHLHPLHLHPIHPLHHHHNHHDRSSFTLHGHGKPRASPPPNPPPPTRAPSRCPPAPSPHPPRDPTYRTQIVEPTLQVRETTRTALQSTTDRTRGRLRRVAGYEVLSAQVPFDWDCISSTVGSSAGRGGGGKWVRMKKKGSGSGRGGGGGLKYPPFGGVERWM